MDSESTCNDSTTAGGLAAELDPGAEERDEFELLLLGHQAAPSLDPALLGLGSPGGPCSGTCFVQIIGELAAGTERRLYLAVPPSGPRLVLAVPAGEPLALSSRHRLTEVERSPAGGGRALLDPGQGPLVEVTLPACYPDERALLDGRFQLDGLAGRGGMSRVYRAKDLQFGRYVAVKVLSLDALEPPFSPATDLGVWRDGVALAQAEGHPNAVAVHARGLWQGFVPYLVMEWLQGETLLARLRRQGPLGPDELLAVLEQLTSVLAHFHRKGIIHRDIKPENVWLCAPGEPDSGLRIKVFDFGLADLSADHPTRLSRLQLTPTRMASVLPLTQRNAGTPPYMAPEQWRGEEQTPATDVWAVGVLSFLLLTGRLPFGSGTGTELERRVLGEPAPQLRALDPRLPRSLGHLVQRMLEKHPGRRPRDGSELLAEVRQTRRRLLARRRLRWLLPGLLVALVVAGAIGSQVVWRATTTQGPTLGGPSAADVLTPGSSASRLESLRRPVRLLVLPFRHPTAQGPEQALWPLADRMVANALTWDELLGGQLERVDPAAVADARARRGLGPELDAAGVAAVVQELRPTLTGAAPGTVLVLVGTIERAQGSVRIRATLQDLDGRRLGEQLGVGPAVVAAAADLAARLRETLDCGMPATPTADRLARLLLTRPAVTQRLPGLDPAAPPAQRRRALAELAQIDPDGAGVAWIGVLDDAWGAGPRAELRRRAATVDDPALARFFSEIGTGHRGPGACAGIDTQELGRRYPYMLGSLADAMCSQLRGDLEEAVRQGLVAADDLRLRRLAALVLPQLLRAVNSCSEQIPALLRLQQLEPERAVGWSYLADVYARCDRSTEARDALEVARSMTGGDRDQDYLIATHGALVRLLDLDVDGAAELIELLDRVRPARTTHDYYVLKSLARYLQGRFREGLAITDRGLAALRTPPDQGWTVLAVSSFYMLLAEGRLAEAGQVLAEYDRLFADPHDQGNRYDVAMLGLALERLQRKIDSPTLLARMKVLGDGVERALGELGPTERTAHECFLLSHLGRTLEDAQLLRAGANLPERAPARSELVGGCRILAAERLLAGGHPAAAREEFRRARREILWAKFIDAEQVPVAVLGEARAAEAVGDGAGARRLLELLVRNYAGADRRLAEVITAQERLARAGR